MSVSLTQVYNPNPGWYRGDFYAHTTCSDGSLTPLNLSRLAGKIGLDFLAMTDHNDISAFDDFTPDHPRLSISGVEVALREGHFNVYGFGGNSAEARQIFCGIIDTPPQRTHNLSLKHRALQELVEHTSLAGYFISLNHPLHDPWEWRDHKAVIGYTPG